MNTYCERSSETRREHAIPLHTTKGSENTNVQKKKSSVATALIFRIVRRMER
jgi:hypothetical protein